MDQLPLLVRRAAEDWRALEDIVLLSKVRANLPALLAEPGLLALALSEIRRIPALYLVLSLASDERLHRELFLRPGLVPAVVRAACAHDDNEDVQNTAMLALHYLLADARSRRDFLRAPEHAQGLARLAARDERPKVQHFALHVLRLLAGEGQAFFRAPGMAAFLFETRHAKFKLQAYARLSGGAAREMLEFPGLVRQLAGFAARGEDLEARMDACRALRGLVEHCPVAALGEPGLIALLVGVGERGDSLSATACSALVRWRQALCPHAPAGRRRREVLAFWRAVPALWALLCPPARKRRSALRRLPREMLWLVGAMAAG
ncbi:hypothetical protein BASA81_005929 [Batrachochytrium salamandrivorans]|nr:hypothetical protein BASA81_013997 [Batrachochytrium salamandrivorans]KAH9256141.1 hypothetical protein BASA81_005929 [Batrachochytrium salamandrivorans]